MKSSRDPGQQRVGDRRRQHEREMACAAGAVPGGIERMVSQREGRLLEHAGPERKLSCRASLLRVRRQSLRPMSERCPARRQRRHATGGNGLPCGGKVGDQDAPRHAVDRQVMNGEQQPSGTASVRHRTRPTASWCRMREPAGFRPLAPRLRCRCAARPHRARTRRSDGCRPRQGPRQAARPPGSMLASLRAQPDAAAMRRDDRARPAAQRSGDPVAGVRAPAAASPG